MRPGWAMDRVVILKAEHNVRCQAFALCDRPAVGQIRHPILGAYVSCQRCADKLDMPLEPAEVEFKAA